MTDETETCPAWLRPLVDSAAGMAVHPRMSPPETGGRPSAVLVLFGMGAAGPDLLLIERSATLRDHAGQPAFPGGAIEPGEGSADAALREAVEETGLDPAGVTVLQTMPELFVHRSGFRVTPVLAWWRRPSEVRAVDPAEVAAVARVPLRELADPANRLCVRYADGVTTPAFRVRDLLVWGFTAGVIDRLLALGGWERPWDRNRIEPRPAAAG